MTSGLHIQRAERQLICPGQVQVSLEYTAPEFPEGTDAQLEVFLPERRRCRSGRWNRCTGSRVRAVCSGMGCSGREYEETWERTDGQVIIQRDQRIEGVLPEGD